MRRAGHRRVVVDDRLVGQVVVVASTATTATTRRAADVDSVGDRCDEAGHADVESARWWRAAPPDPGRHLEHPPCAVCDDRQPWAPSFVVCAVGPRRPRRRRRCRRCRRRCRLRRRCQPPSVPSTCQARAAAAVAVRCCDEAGADVESAVGWTAPHSGDQPLVAALRRLRRSQAWAPGGPAGPVPPLTVKCGHTGTTIPACRARVAELGGRDVDLLTGAGTGQAGVPVVPGGGTSAHRGRDRKFRPLAVAAAAQRRCDSSSCG